MLKNIVLLAALLLVPFSLIAHQIDEAEHYYAAIKKIAASENFSPDSMSALSSSLAHGSEKYLAELFSQLSAECVRQSDEETGYYASLLAAVCYYDRHLYCDALKYANLAFSFNHTPGRLTYLHFIKGKIYVAMQKFDLAYESFSTVMESPDTDINQMLKCESCKALSEYYLHYNNVTKALEYLQSYTSAQDTIVCGGLNRNCCILPSELRCKYLDRKVYISGIQTITDLNEQNQRQRTAIILLVSGGVLILSFASFAAYRWASLSKANARLNMRNQGIETRQSELEAAQAGLTSLSLIAAQTSNAFLVADSTGKITWVNSGFEKLYNQNLRQYILENGENLFYSNDTSRKTALENCRELQKTQICHFKYIGGTRPKWILSTISPVVEANKISKYVIIENDITEIKNSEQKLIENNGELKQLSANLEIKNRRITGSLRSAQIIQQLLLPLPQTISKYYRSFVIYRPKDIVSGDFYWFTHSVLTDTSIVAVGDCTGHGVPGAMMSVLMIRILDEISAANADVTPAQILSQMQNKVVEMLKQRQTDNTDGLDITIAKIQRRKDTADVTIAGAKSYCAFYQMAHNATQLVKGTKKSIGGADEEQKVFEDRTFALASGDRIFLSSDGFIDQNNPDRKCIGSQRFADIIQQSSQLSIDKQQQYIENALAQWQQDQPQRDDICIVGIQI